MALRPEKVQGVLQAPAPKRYSHFISVAADQLRVWSLYQDGFAAVGDNDGNSLFPVWAESDYAELCAVGEWQGYQCRAIPLDEFLDVFLKKFVRSGTMVAVMMTPTGQGPIVDAAKLDRDLRSELLRLE